MELTVEGKPSITWDVLAHFTERQKEAERAVEKYKYILFGGAMGGGKSYWLRWMLVRLLMQFAKQGKRGVRVGLFCEDYPALQDRHLSKVKTEFPQYLGTFNTHDKEFTLAPCYGGGVICFRNLDDTSKYQSSEFAVIAVDELTKNPKDTFNFLRTRLRWSNLSGVKFIAGSNPGGLGHQWVKDIWLNKEFEEGEQEQDLFYFIPAKATDNPNLAKSYYTALEGLPEKMRKAYIEGNWDIFEGQFFTEWNKDVHVIDPYIIPDHWSKFRSIDPSGRDGVTSCHWYAIDHDGKVIVYKEYYSQGKDADQHADKITQMSVDELDQPESYKYTIIDTAAFSKLGLPETIAEVYARHGIYDLVPASKDRVTGWNSVHYYLRHDKENDSKLKIFSTCFNLIRTLPLAIHDELHPEDVDSTRQGKEHWDALDDLRYFLQTVREQKTRKPLSIVERRIEALKNQDSHYDFSYKRNINYGD